MSGTFTSTDGTTGDWAATTAQSSNGTYSGALSTDVNPPPVPISVTLTLTQNSSYGLTGTATFMHSSCFQTLSFSGDVIGGSFLMQDSTGVLIVGGVQLSSNQLAFAYYVNSGCGAGGDEWGVLTAQ